MRTTSSTEPPARRFALFGVVAAAMLAVAAAPADAEEYSCPASIRVKQGADAGQNGWQIVASDATHQLASVGFFDGHPRQEAALKPLTNRKRGTTRTMTWAFGGGGAMDVWVSCAYRSTRVEMARQILTGSRSCSVIYDEQPNRNPVVKRISCTREAGAAAGRATQ